MSRFSLRTSASLRSLALMLLAATTTLGAQGTGTAGAGANGGGGAIDEAYSQRIREYTSDTLFIAPTVATVPMSATVPSPLKHFGTIIGAPGVMHHTAEIYGYFKALAAATPRVRFETIGTTEEGRDITLAIVASEASMAELEVQRRNMARLADPRGVSASELEPLLAATKPIYYLNAGLHSPEMGSPEMVMELAYRLAVSDEPAIRRIRENVIVLINPASEPDGRDKQVDWYLDRTKGRPEFDDGFPRSTPYWGRYVVHDNNRDGLQISQALSHAIYDTYYKWHPLVMHDLHESVPLLYISTGTGPYNVNNDPIAISEWQLLANSEITALSAYGMPGVWTWGFFDGWWPGYGVWVANNHNSIGRFYETFGNAGADTYVRDLSDARYAGDPVTSRQWYRSWPPTKKVRWSARDNVNYMQAGVLAALTFTANNGEMLLRNFWQKSSNSLGRGRTQKPYAFSIPGFERQQDPKRTAYLINQLQRHAIEVHRVTAGDSTGDFIVKLDQPYRDLAVNLLTTQQFPSTAQYPPYDDIAWTLGYLYGVEVKAVDDSSVLARTDLAAVTDSVVATATATGAGSGRWSLVNTGQGEILPALYWLKEQAPKARAFANESALARATDTLPAGSVLFQGLDAATARELAARYALPLRDMAGSSGDASTAMSVAHELDLPRIAVYHTWYDTQDEGWTRYTLEQYGIPYTSIDKDVLKSGRLRARFDVILVPQARGDVGRLVHGVDPRWGPLPYRKTDRTPSLGTPAATDDMTGGMGFEGLNELRKFLADGGTMITLGNSSRLAAETGLVRDMGTKTTRTLFHPGSVVRARTRRAVSPILYGFPETFTIFRGNGPLFTVAERDSAAVVLQYGTKLPDPPKPDGVIMGMPSSYASKRDQAVKAVLTQGVAGDSATADSAAGTPSAAKSDSGSGGSYVVSGMVRGESEIIGEAAILDVPVGKGRVIAFSFDPLHRFLNHHDFPLVWNAIMNWNDHVRTEPATTDR
jgi:hypothetical protein